MLKQGKKPTYERVVLCGGDRERWKHWTVDTRPGKIQHLPAPKEKDIKHAKKVWWVGWCFL